MRVCVLIFIILFGLSACFLDDETYAPVVEVNTIEPIPKNGQHRVSADETLYSIAWRYGFDYVTLAKLNGISPPYAIKTGQIIFLTKKPLKKSMAAKPVKVVKPDVIAAPVPEPTASVKTWQWPAKGPVVGHFSSSNKGINIAGHLGDPVYATAAGKVVYSGNGLRGYGNLIIIKHNSSFLTAYAHNDKIGVHDGDWVKAGQKIAEMGKTGTQRVMLHFEIRRNGQPVNPTVYLKT